MASAARLACRERSSRPPRESIHFPGSCTRDVPPISPAHNPRPIRAAGKSILPLFNMKRILLPLAALFFLAAQAPAQTATAPASVIHVVTVKWKPDATAAQIQAALDGVKKLPEQFPGVTRVWTKSIKVQGGKANAIVMEFKDEAQLKAYADSPAQKEWYKLYTPIRAESTTFDITN